MLINKFQVQLATAYPDLQPLDTKKGRTLRGEIATDFGSVPAYIKLLNIGDVAKEAICAVLGRKLGLPIPQPYYVQVDPSFTGHQLANIHGVAFGLHAELILTPRIHDIALMRAQLRQWSELGKCAVFDAWIANRDRLPQNLLFEGNNGFWLIDHEEALPRHLSPMSPIGTQLFDLIKEDKSEHELYQEREKLARHAEAINQVDWKELIELVRPEHLPESDKYFGEYVVLLKERAENMYKIITAELGIKQMSIDFDRLSEIEKKSKAEQK